MHNTIASCWFEPKGIRVGFAGSPSVFIEARYLDRIRLHNWEYDLLHIRSLFPRDCAVIMGWVYVKPYERNVSRLFTFVEWLKSK